MIPDNENIIDITMEAFKDVSITLNGEVLLEKTLDNNGNISGYLTISVDKIMALKEKTDEELTQMGWGKYKHILDSF